jgi:hypothetical protein
MIAIEAAHEAEVALATLSGVKHTERLGQFVALPTARDCVALTTFNSERLVRLLASFRRRNACWGQPARLRPTRPLGPADPSTCSAEPWPTSDARLGVATRRTG